ncbi:ribonuclease H-like domain-containing protein [Tanacetum coccineum]
MNGGARGSNSNELLSNNLDAGDLFHMHSNDNSSVALISFKLLGTENYKIWSGAMKLALQARNKFKFVDGRESFATSDVIGLEETYDKVDESIIYNLLQNNNCIKQGGSPVVDYYHRLNSLWREFDALTKLPTCTYDANKELLLHHQLMKLMKFLMGFDDCYRLVRSVLLTRDPLTKVKDEHIIMSKEESYKEVCESSSMTETKLSDTSFASKSFNNNKRVVNNNNNNNNNNNHNNNQWIDEANPKALLDSRHWSTCRAVHIFSRISFAIAKGVRAHIVNRLSTNFL